ncbi:MAG: hypothetical protein WAN14_18155 [Candidatus Acidiferrales bacterium]
MFTVILRSVCCGIVALAAVIFLGIVALIFVGFYLALKNPHPGGGVVGWDVVSIFHNTFGTILLLPLLIFAVGFLLGFRHFSKSLASK